ncbi:MAG: PASTA domain-containing protein [Gemmatimonadetes bacterium]|nr:PASTA domain-containing protein [Gemmatimonadota bacterium]
MKLGDSLGRRRGRRRSANGSEDGAASGEGQSTPRGATFGQWMEGQSLFPQLRGRNLLLGVGGLALLGWAFGYGFATRVLFPAPPPPGDLFEVPDLRGMGLASASERLAGVGLEMGSVDSLQHPSVVAGLVLGQSPLPGQLSRPANPVRVSISTGPQSRSVPDVLGLIEDRARIVLETSGFVVNLDTVESEEPRGRVVSVSPAPGAVVALPSEIRVRLSAGPPVVAMPFVLGLERAAAEMLLDSLGLVVSDVDEVFRFGRDQGIVVEQEPAAETELRRGSSVRLTVGRGGGGGQEQ